MSTEAADPSQGRVVVRNTGSGLAAWLDPGETASMTVRGGPRPSTRLGFAVYELVD